MECPCHDLHYKVNFDEPGSLKLNKRQNTFFLLIDPFKVLSSICIYLDRGLGEDVMRCRFIQP